MKSKSSEQAFMFPLAQLAASLALGVVVGSFTALHLALLILGGIVSAVVSLVLLVKRRRGAASALLTLGFLFAGAALAILENGSVRGGSIKELFHAKTIQSGAPVELTGVLTREPESARDRRYLTLRVESIALGTRQLATEGLITLLLPVSPGSKDAVDELQLTYGTRIRVMTTLEREDEFRNPGVSSFIEYLDREGYDATGFVKSPLLIERLGDDRVFLPLALLFRWRSLMQASIDANFSPDTAGVLDAALLGNRHNLSYETGESFREGGTFHVLVISGLHITFLGAVVFFLTRQFTKNRLLQFLLSAAVVWGYSIAVGADPSVVRAALMFTIVLLAPLASRKASSLNALGGVAIILLVWRPSDLLDPSFQLTFVSVLAIVVFAWPLIERMKAIGSWRPTRDTPYPPVCPVWLKSLSELLFWGERQANAERELSGHSYRLFKLPLATALERIHVQWLLRYVFVAVVVSVSVQVMLLPFLVVYFHRFSLASFVLNIAVSLLMAGVAISAIAGLMLTYLSSALGQPLLMGAEVLNWLMIHSVDPFERTRLASLRVPEYSGWAAALYGLYYVPLAVNVVQMFRWQPLPPPAEVTRRNRNRRIALIVPLVGQALVILMVILHPWSAQYDKGMLRVDFLDVGQGDSALITSPNGTTLLIDGGGRPGPFQADKDEGPAVDRKSIGEIVTSEYLWWRGLDRIDYLVATHADADHIDGLSAVAKNFGVRAVLIARTPDKDPEFAKLANRLSAERIPLRMISRGDELHVDDLSIKSLHPLPSIGSHLPSTNNDSVVLQLKYGMRTFLMTADIEARAEKSLLRDSANLVSDVVKVAHHGSKTSSTPEFVSATKARFAVMSVGQKSMFGHPHTQVVERWKANGATVLTTGERGTITFLTDGSTLEVFSFVSAGE